MLRRFKNYLNVYTDAKTNIKIDTL